MAQSSSLRDRKKQRTRRSIEQAALRLFEERGFDGTTIDDIAAAAEVAPRTFFHYFPSKEDVALADHATRLEQIVAALKASPADQAPWRALRGAFLAVGPDYEAEREHLLRRIRIIQATPSVAARNLQLQTTWEEAIAEVVADWLNLEDPGDVRPRLIAGAALAAMRASLRRWLTDDGASRLPDHTSRIASTYWEPGWSRLSVRNEESAEHRDREPPCRDSVDLVACRDCGRNLLRGSTNPETRVRASTARCPADSRRSRIA